jgi:hypothetical protein
MKKHINKKTLSFMGMFWQIEIKPEHSLLKNKKSSHEFHE